MEPEAAAGIGTPGEPLPPALREAAQAALGADLGPVRLHRGAVAEGAASALGARAYAFGAHVVLGTGWDGPATASGRRLLAHELAHVAVQAHQGQACVQRETVTRAPAEDDFEPADTGPDPAALVGALPGLFGKLKTVTLDERARADGVSRSVLQPAECFVYAENYIVVIRSDGTVRDVDEQDTSKPLMFDAPVLLLRELRTGRIWFVGQRGENIAIQSFRRYVAAPKPDRPAGQSVLLAFLPGVLIPPELARSLRRRARGGSGTEAEAPEWARDATARLRKRRAGRPATGGEGTGTGASGEGTGGGGTADRSTAAGAGTPPAEPGVLRGPATYEAGVSRTGVPELRITIDRASTTTPFRQNESDASLDRRVKAAEQALQESRDPSRHGRVAGGADATGFTPPPPGATGVVVPVQDAQDQARASAGARTPGERAPGGRTGANAPGYPAKLTMAGTAPQEPAVSSPGATNRFAMNLDYAALSFGVQDEALNRMQTVQFYWEVIEVTGRADAADRTTRAGKGRAQSEFDTLGANLTRDQAAIAEDQANDLAMMREQQWSWPARASYLAVIGLSNTVRVVGSIAGSFLDTVTKSLDERSISFDHEGDFLVRCVATPQWSDAAVADPEHHVRRASSFAVKPVRIVPLGSRAAEGADHEASSLAAARAELEKALASGDPRRIARARAELARLVTAGRMSSFETYTRTVSALRGRLDAARRLRDHRARHTPVSELADDEVVLDIELIQTGRLVDEFIAETERQLTHVAGEGGSHERWVREQYAWFSAVGGVTDFRPRLALASEENGQVTEVRTMLGELRESREGDRRWALVDITSAGSRDVHIGRSALPGFAGRAAAIRDAFRVFAENSGYGRGTIAIRLPQELTAALGAPVPIEAAMRSAPGAHDRVMQRLRDLAIVAEIAGIFATGGLALAVGVVGGLAGAVTAIDSLARRYRTDHTWELSTVFDVLGVVGGIASTLSMGTVIARNVAETGAAAGRLPSWINRVERTERGLHVHGVLTGGLQITVLIPLQLALEWNEIDHAEGLSDSERDARRARALLGALRSGAITVVTTGGGVGHGEGKRPGTGGAEEPLPPGAGAPEAQHLADGSGPPRPPVREGAAPGARPEAGPVAGAEGGAVAGTGGPAETAVADQVARSHELAAGRLAADRRAAAAAEPRTAGPEHTQEGAGEPRTAAGTTRGPRPPEHGRGDVNTAERDAARHILGVRLGHERPPGPADPAAPRPRPGAFGSRTTSGEQAVATYDQAVAAARGAEVGLFFNPNTGEFAVQTGTEFSVRAPAGDGWQALVHLHPNPGNVIVRRLPAPADVALAVRAAFRSGSHTEFVQSTRPDGSTGITRVTVTTDPVRIVVEAPAAPGEPAQRIEVDSPEAYSREYGERTTYVDPTSPEYQWIVQDLDDYYRLREEDARSEAGLGPAGSAEADPGDRTAAGTAKRRNAAAAAKAEATAEIARLRARLYRWRSTAGDDPAAAALIDHHLAALRGLAEDVRRGQPVEGALAGIREDLPEQRSALRSVDAARVRALAARARWTAGRSRDPEAVAELTAIAGEADRLADRLAANPDQDVRTAYDMLDRRAGRATRRDFEVYIALDQPGERARMMAWFEENLAPLNGTPVGELLVRDIMRHLETADALTLAQSPRAAGVDVANTAAMRRRVREGIEARAYSDQYTALFQAAVRDAEAQDFTDGWPRTTDGRVWEVDHVAELWLGGADDASNYLALPPAVHDQKSTIIGRFRREFRTRSVTGESLDLRETDEPEPPSRTD
ncbi:DUF4157 domain-containing protein [Kitasatospora sp. NPDC050463]|uniref:eCIS core domain-containing protein n=1 Tax=Kitasatospora sp. NPDC050463 TaxID=3155786 RepID=UPI0033EBEDE6